MPAATVGGVADTPIFDLGNLNVGEGENQWTVKDTKIADGKQTVVYAYNSTVAKDASTAALFDTATLKAAMLNAEVNALAAEEDIAVDAFAIQSANLSGIDAAVAESGWIA